MNYQEACQALEALYAQVPSVQCQGLCTEACGPIGMSHIEWMRIRRASPLRLAESKTTRCPLLRNGRCTVYALRPLICRIWASAENMVCPWHCRPDRFLTIAEADELMKAVEQVSAILFPGSAPKTFHTPAQIEQVQEQGALAVAWAVLATAGSL